MRFKMDKHFPKIFPKKFKIFRLTSLAIIFCFLLFSFIFYHFYIKFVKFSARSARRCFSLHLTRLKTLIATSLCIYQYLKKLFGLEKEVFKKECIFWEDLKCSPNVENEIRPRFLKVFCGPVLGPQIR